MSLSFTNVNQFKRDLDKFAEMTETSLEQIYRKVALDVFSGVTERTPVDLGNARASWNLNRVTINPAVQTQVKGGEGAAQAANSVQQAGFGPGPLTDIYITNSLPYIGRLEAGHSKQTGKGFMIQRTMSLVAQSVRAAVRGL